MPYLACARPALQRCAFAAVAGLWLAFAGSGVASAATVYKWVDSSGVTHLSSERPPSGIPFERISLGSTNSAARTASGRSGSRSTARVAAVSPEQAARRNDALASLQTRECVVALEALDRVGRGGQPVEPTEFRRLQQTVDRNCSSDPVRRREQEEMAARLRVAKSDRCIEARNELADMLEPGRRPTRDQLKAQQEFIEAHCRAPVR